MAEQVFPEYEINSQLASKRLGEVASTIDPYGLEVENIVLILGRDKENPKLNVAVQDTFQTQATDAFRFFHREQGAEGDESKALAILTYKRNSEIRGRRYPDQSFVDKITLTWIANAGTNGGISTARTENGSTVIHAEWNNTGTLKSVKYAIGKPQVTLFDYIKNESVLQESEETEKIVWTEIPLDDDRIKDEFNIPLQLVSDFLAPMQAE